MERWIRDAGHLRAEGGEYIEEKMKEKTGIKDVEKKLIDHAKNKARSNDEAVIGMDRNKKGPPPPAMTPPLRGCPPPRLDRPRPVRESGGGSPGPGGTAPGVAGL